MSKYLLQIIIHSNTLLYLIYKINEKISQYLNNKFTIRQNLINLYQYYLYLI